MNLKLEHARFQKLITELAEDGRTLRMKRYIQHSNKSTYDHCMDVARHSFFFAKRLHLRVDEAALVRGAFLHDYYLYDWHNAPKKAGLHGLTHAHRARKNAERDFHLNQRERNIIESHMWPLTLTKVPTSKEAAVVCFVDKVCSLRETLNRK